MATVYRLPGDTDDFVTVADEGDTKPATTGGFVPQMVYADNTVGPFDTSQLATGFDIPPHDAVELGYDGSGRVETVDFYSGGIGGTLEGTVTLTYDGNGRVSTVAFT